MVYQLASRSDPETVRVLTDTIVLCVAANPDGQELVANWYMREKDPLKKWKLVLINPKATGAAKKKAIVAVGRRLAIDLWRINTGKSTAAKLGLK